MKYSLLFIALLACCTASAQQPSFDEVILEFFHNYQPVESPRFLRLQKKKEGWFTAEVTYEAPNIYENLQLFWNASSRRFEKLDYPLVADTSEAAVSRAMDEYKTYNIGQYEEQQFARHRYYGYPGWDWDIIQELKNQANLPDLELESLARSYSSYASGYFFDLWGYHFQNGDPDRTILKDTMVISASRKDKFISYVWKAIETYERLKKQNPSYPTTVGRIDIKTSNEYIFAWSNLRFAGFQKDAEQFIAGVRYPDSLLKKTREYFRPMKPNAIFIASGDNDTYPLWYLQHKEGYRKDVSVINHSLLAMRRYLKYLSAAHKNTFFNTTAADYMKPDFDYAVYSGGECKQPVPLSRLRSLITISDGRRVFSCNELVKPINPSLSANIFKGKTMLPSMKIQLGNYIFMNDYLILDMIEKHFYKRPVYFSWPEQVPGLVSYMKQEGLVYWLAPIK